MEKANRLIIGHKYIYDRYAECSPGCFYPAGLEHYWTVFLKEILNDTYLKVSTILYSDTKNPKYAELVIKKENLYSSEN